MVNRMTELDAVVARLLKAKWKEEIERAISGVKRTEFDRWMRKEWYRARYQR